MSGVIVVGLLREASSLRVTLSPAIQYPPHSPNIHSLTTWPTLNSKSLLVFRVTQNIAKVMNTDSQRHSLVVKLYIDRGVVGDMHPV